MARHNEPKPLAPGKAKKLTPEERAAVFVAYRLQPGEKRDPRSYNMRKPHLAMTPEQLELARAVGMGPRAALLLLEHPVCTRCGSAWDVAEARRIACTACNLAMGIAEGMDQA